MTTQAMVFDPAPVPAEVEPPQSGILALVERMAANPNIDVAKLEKVIELQERILAHEAKSAFQAAFAKMQPELPEISEKGQIIVKGTLRSTYARLEDIQAQIRPILKTYGFAIRHRTEWPTDKPGIVRVVGILSHAAGHSEESAFEAPADKSDFRTEIQSQGSTVSYGRRYTTLDLTGIITRGRDNDGSTSGAPEPPAGYQECWAKLEAAAGKGVAAVQAVWQAQKSDFKNYTVQHNKAAWEALKVRGVEAGQ
jgi:hypothetical protein